MASQQSPMSPTEWGTAAWKFLHACSFAYPDNPNNDKKEAMKCVLENLGRILPCPKCARHYEENIREMPPALESKDALSKWVVELHNRVNSARRMPTVDYDTVRRHYLENTGELQRNHRIARKTSASLHLVYGSVILILLATVFVVAKRRRR